MAYTHRNFHMLTWPKSCFGSLWSGIPHSSAGWCDLILVLHILQEAPAIFYDISALRFIGVLCGFFFGAQELFFSCFFIVGVTTVKARIARCYDFTPPATVMYILDIGNLICIWSVIRINIGNGQWHYLW